MAVVGDDDLPGVDPGGRQAPGGHGGGDQPAAEQLTGGGNQVEKDRVRLAPVPDRGQRRAQVVEMPVDGREQQGAVEVRAEARRLVDVPAPEHVDPFIHLAANVPEPGQLSQGEEPVGHATQGRHHDHWHRPRTALPADDADHPLDGGGIHDRRSAEFHYYRTHGTPRRLT